MIWLFVVVWEGIEMGRGGGGRGIDMKGVKIFGRERNGVGGG